jgi:hypothetical protein
VILKLGYLKVLAKVVLRCNVTKGWLPSRAYVYLLYGLIAGGLLGREVFTGC